LSIDLDGANHLLQGVFADRAVVGNFLDVGKTPIGLKADLPQSGQVLQEFADAEVARVVDRGFRAEGSSLSVVLLDPGILVIDMQGGNDSLGNYSCPESAGRSPADPAVEDQCT
jgi:hypothetical protein